LLSINPTTAVNLALALQAEGAKVALLDADIYGPSQPRMLGVSKLKPEQTGEGKLLPILGHGMQSMSIGYLVDEENPMTSKSATFAPSACSASAKLTAVVDLPTPPLPEATAIIFLTSGRISTPFCVEYLAIFVSILTVTSLMLAADSALVIASVSVW
jgi:hypothetical protein